MRATFKIRSNPNENTRRKDDQNDVESFANQWLYTHLHFGFIELHHLIRTHQRLASTIEHPAASLTYQQTLSDH